MAKLRKWFTYRQISGFMVPEFHEDGRPHLHLAVDCEKEPHGLREAWSRISGNLSARVDAQAIYDQSGLARYLSKRETKCPPDSFGPVGKYWSAFGPNRVKPQHVVPLDTIVGTELRSRIVARHERALTRKGFPPDIATEYASRPMKLVGWGMAQEAQTLLLLDADVADDSIYEANGITSDAVSPCGPLCGMDTDECPDLPATDQTETPPRASELACDRFVFAVYVPADDQDRHLPKSCADCPYRFPSCPAQRIFGSRAPPGGAKAWTATGVSACAHF